MKKLLARIIASANIRLKVRKEIPAGLEQEFVSFKDTKSIDRIQASAWIGFALTLCMFGLDIYRIKTDIFFNDDFYPILFYFHILGLLFIVPAIHTTRNKAWIIQTRLRRGLVIWGMVALVGIFLLGQSVIIYLQRDSLVMFLGFVFVFTWMFSMSHKERIIFTVPSLLIITVTIFFPNEEFKLNEAITNFIEVIFLSIAAFLFDSFDYNLNLSNFMNLREIEREQERIKKLEEFKSRFFTNLTHELRTPLTMISGMAREIAEDPKRWAGEGTEIINRNAGNLLNLVNQILALSKIESGNMPLHMIQGDIVSYLGYVVDAFKGHALAKHITLHYLPEENEIIMDYDPEKYMTILSNLLSNAIKFTPEHGNVYVHLVFRKIVEDSFLEMTVKDSGTGIPPEELDYIFERFYQTQNELSNAGIGTGIGLSLVNEFIKMLDGEIQVKSTPGKGTTFIISLPVTTEATSQGTPLFKEDIKSNVNFFLTPVQQEEVSMIQEDDQDRPEILIIDDNTDVLRYLQVCLEDLFQLTFCRDGQTGIDKAIEMVPDLILSDVLMPVKDGLAVCRELKQHTITSHIPIVLLSAKVDPESRIAGLKSGADVYMLKPFEKQELRMQLHNLLERRQELHARYSDPGSVPSDPDQEDQTPEDQFVTRVRTVVMDHLDETELSVTHLCRAIFLSRTQLHKKLKALTGKSATHFIRHVRLLKGREMMSDPNLSISDIAYQVGFSDPNYFTRCFVQEFGETPSETRK